MSETPIDMGMVSAPSAAPAAPAAPPAPTPAAARPTPGSPEWSALTTEQRHAQLRGPENPRARGHSPALDHREATAARASGEPTPAGEAPAADPAASQDEPKFKIGKYEVSESQVASMMERQAVDDLRKATIPPTADAYRAELPADLKLPGGIEYKFDQGNPSLAAAKNWAHAKGLSQQEFSEVLSIYASHEATQEAALAERSRAEIAKAGVNAPQRVDAVGKWITGMVGEAEAAPIRRTLVTDAHLRFFEKIINLTTNQGGASFSAAHRVPADNNTSIPGYSEMSFEQRRFAQDQRRR